MAKFDLTSTLGQYLDRHLVFPLLEFISAKNIYDETELLHAKLDIISKTKMVDYLIDIRKQLHSDEEVPEDLKQHRANVVSRLGEYQNDVSFVYKILTNDDFMNKSENTRDSEIFVQKLKKEYNFDISVMPKVYQAAKYSYECGNYTLASSQLYFCTLVLPPSDKTYLNVLWGKLATEILIQNWNSALEDLNKLREYIDSNPFGSALQLLQQRTWLIHWSLFVFYNHEDGKSLLVEMFLYRPHYLNAIQTMCPHILRYLATAVITSHHLATHSHRNVLKDLVKVIQQESYTYRDPITEFLEHLYVNFDFEGARQKLHECQTVLFNDFFVTACLADFVENARLMIFETFCRIHKCISIGMLAEKLNMNPEEAECWIVDLIRSVHLDAKIDSKLGHVVMGTQALSPYQQLVDKIDSLAERSEILHNLVIRKLKPLNQDFRWGASEF